MEYDSASSCDERLREREACARVPLDRDSFSQRNPKHSDPEAWRTFNSVEVSPAQPKISSDVARKSLSKQVMEYYQKYSRNSNLDQYFSLPETREETHGVQYYYSIYELNPRASGDRQGCVGQDYSLGTYVPRERRRWARPPLIGQSSNTDASSLYRRPLAEARSPSPEPKHAPSPDTIAEEQQDSRESRDSMPDNPERKSTVSPTSSVASHKPLEWDSGADVGYYNDASRGKRDGKNLSTIERMALAGGCSAALRLDPEGTTESNSCGKPTVPAVRPKTIVKPDANSTPLPENVSEGESEVEITPIVKNHLPGIITGTDVRSEERVEPDRRRDAESSKNPSVFSIPSVKYATEGARRKPRYRLPEEIPTAKTSILKKSSSMNLLAPIASRFVPKRSQSELNLLERDKPRVALPLISDSTSSLATVVNKPQTRDQVIQTTIIEHFQESIGVQVSVVEEEKPPVPKRGTSLAPRSVHSILKSTKNTYKVRESMQRFADGDNRWQRDPSNAALASQTTTTEGSALEPSRSPTPRPDDTENAPGRANSFEYFPGHVYENVPNGSGSHVSSVDTRCSNSTTMPNTSSSIDEKLWADSDSLVRDLERSVNILKTLVDTNKCDKQAKKRLIHHVVKRLVTAKYTDDKIERDLEENVPWNPDDARKKVYRADIIEALTKKPNASYSSDESRKPPKKKREALSPEERINSETSTSDKFDARTDRTEMDGRKARMGLRADDQRSTSSPTDAHKSESSECFLPQSSANVRNRGNIPCLNNNADAPRRRDTSTSDTPTDRNRIFLDTVANDRPSLVESTNGSGNSLDWRVPTTMSERQFDLRRRVTSESGDSKLVSYAETEKRNQLVWITNEISHLSNLKKLLEQPKKILERPRLSPKKLRQPPIKQKPLALVACPCGRKIFNEPSRELTFPDGSESLIDRQWSSHCNLAGCQSPIVGSEGEHPHRPKKRNSCTQTALDPARAYSRTGGEIISAAAATSKNRSPVAKSTFACVQTSETVPLQSRMVPRSLCPVHGQYDSRCKCYQSVERPHREVHSAPSPSIAVCSCHLSPEITIAVPIQNFPNLHRRESSPSRNSDHTRDNDERNIPGGRYVRAKEKDNFKSEPKEAKNKSNATKITRNCDCNVHAKRAESDAVKCKKLLAQVCELCLKKIEQLDEDAGRHCETCARNIRRDVVVDENVPPGHSKLCGCSELSGCDCEGNVAIDSRNDRERATSDDSRECNDHAEKERICTLHGDRIEEYRRDHTGHKCSTTNKTESKSRYLSDAHQFAQRSRPDSGKDCKRAIEPREAEHKTWSPGSNRSRESSRDEHSDRSSRSCRGCGGSYKNGKKCTCRVNYPKPIAYELSFGADRPIVKHNDVCASKNHRMRIDELTKNSPPLSPNSKQKSGGCSCDGIKSPRTITGKNRKKTLQDYLAQNKPDFLNNAETRQQYMFEISQLRELRKEKRVQLLALASGSSLLKTPRTLKPNGIPCFQRKLSDEEVKERSRKRYYKLHEVRSKRQQREKQEQARRNKLTANIFCKKLQQKVLRGQVDLSNSVSVISNL